MPRISIDDELYADPRFIKLCSKLGSFELAIGSLVVAWRQAQKIYSKESSRISLEDWKKLGLNNEIIECGLAEKNESGVLLSGIDNQFGWLLKRRENAKIGGKNRASKRKQTQAKVSKRSPITIPITITNKKKNISFTSFTDSSSLELIDSIYQEYPRREGKTNGYKFLTQLLKKCDEPLELAERIKSAARNYATQVAAEKTEKKFIKMFSTFAHQWQDYEKPEDKKQAVNPYGEIPEWLKSNESELLK